MSESLPTIIMTASAIVLGIAGISMLFLPVEASVYLAGVGMTETAGQMISAGLLAFALLNWIGRTAVYGGIYGRPIILGNFLFGFIMATTLIDAALTGGGAGPAVAAGCAVMHGAAFGYLLVSGSPTFGSAGE